MVRDEDMFEAYYQCCRHKGGSLSKIEYSLSSRKDLIRLVDEVNDRTYRPSTSITFVVTNPKYREVFAASFRDRIIHHYLAIRIEPLLEAVFGDRTFNCRKEKGVLFGINMLKEDIKQCSEGYTKDCWIMKLDLKGFFMSINKPLLDRLLVDFITRYYEGADKEDVLWLTHLIVMHRPELDCVRRSDPEKWTHLPPNKSLFTNDPDCGLAIGNLPSQLFANFLLNILDWYIDTELGLKYHGRYVDDFYIVHTDKKELLDSVPKIRQILKERCMVSLHPDKFYIQHYSKGIKFTGAVVKYGRVYPANRTVGNFTNAIYKLNHAREVEGVTKCIQSINSYLGILIHMDSYAIRRKILGMIDRRLFKYIYIRGHFEVVCLKEKYKRIDSPWRDRGLKVYYAKDLNDHELILDDDE